MLASAVWFWRALAVRGGEAPTVAVALLATMTHMGMLGAILTFAGQPLYAPHLTTTLAWGLTPLQDQQLAGLAMWVLGALPYLGAALACLGGWLGRLQKQDTGAGAASWRG